MSTSFNQVNTADIPRLKEMSIEELLAMQARIKEDTAIGSPFYSDELREAAKERTDNDSIESFINMCFEAGKATALLIEQELASRAETKVSVA